MINYIKSVNEKEQVTVVKWEDLPCGSSLIPGNLLHQLVISKAYKKQVVGIYLAL
jgi:hypothetical protein